MLWSRCFVSILEVLYCPRSARGDVELKSFQKMYHCIDQLNEQNRALILLELENIPQATIADTVGLAHGTLRTRLSRIRKSLLKCIKNGKRQLK